MILAGNNLIFEEKIPIAYILQRYVRFYRVEFGRVIR